MSVSQAYNFKSINPLVSTSGLLNEEQLGDLAAEGYEAMINLLPHDSEYAIADETEIVAAQGLEYIYIPVDFSAPTADDLQQFIGSLSGLSGKKVMIHCAANYRVSAFYAIYAHRQLGWSQVQARELIASIWDSSEYPAWSDFIDKQLGA